MQITEKEVFIGAAGALLAANLLAYGFHVARNGLPDGKAKDAVQKVVYELDRICDNMENPEKRRLAIQQVNDVLGWRKILVPSALIGWIIDAEVAAIRKMQAATDTPNLHEEEKQ
jgi:hypothetical protein